MNEIVKYYQAISFGKKRNIHKELFEEFPKKLVTPLGSSENYFYDFPEEGGIVISNPHSKKNLPIAIIENKEEKVRAFIEVNLKYVLKETKLK